MPSRAANRCEPRAVKDRAIGASPAAFHRPFIPAIFAVISRPCIARARLPQRRRRRRRCLLFTRNTPAGHGNTRDRTISSANRGENNATARSVVAFLSAQDRISLETFPNVPCESLGEGSRRGGRRNNNNAPCPFQRMRADFVKCLILISTTGLFYAKAILRLLFFFVFLFSRSTRRRIPRR